MNRRIFPVLAISASLLLIEMTLAATNAVDAAPVVPPWRIANPWTSQTGTVEIGDQTLTVEIADTGDLQTRGLGYRDGLEQASGMLFTYDLPSIHTFWMKGMRFCLDIVWIENNQIVGAAESVCPMPNLPDQDLPHYMSPEHVRYVLEVPAGWLKDHGFGAGTPVSIRLPG
jgi:uncharacterized membrane protein (UPF0127 family)